MKTFLCILTVDLLCVCGMAADVEIRSNKRLKNSLGMELVRIEPGRYLMGDARGEFDEQPSRNIEISQDFYIGTTEVTNAQYEQFDSTHHSYRGKHGFSNTDNEAVIFVSWQDAVRFCQWLSEREGKTYRLPTEAEWEYVCRAGTTTAYSTGDTWPTMYHKNQQETWKPQRVDLRVAQFPANPWGLFDLHGNVEEWCMDWYGPYRNQEETDPVGPATGDFKVTRGGSHGTDCVYLRSANRSGTLPDDKHEMIGFRIVQTVPSLNPPIPRIDSRSLWANDVSQDPCTWPTGGSSKPVFFGPIDYVRIPAGSNGPLYSRHNHCPAITACPNGDLLAIWYTCNTEPGRELAIAASRLRKDKTEWDPASLFWDVPDRNDHGSEIWWDGQTTLFHFNGLSSDATWGKLALVMRTSMDNGQSWTTARLIEPEHELRNQVIAGMIRTRSGRMILPCDAVTEGSGGTAVHISDDGGMSWFDPGKGKPSPRFSAGRRGAWIAGIHARIVELHDGRMMALGRGDSIDGRMPVSISNDKGLTWEYKASPFHPIGSGQRLVLMRLREGPILFVSFSDPSSLLNNPKGIAFKDSNGQDRRGYGMYAALSMDEGQSWPLVRLITPGGIVQTKDGGAWTGPFTLDETHAEPKGYLAATQTPDGLIHLISSRLYYRFNLAWLTPTLSSGSSGN